MIRLWFKIMFLCAIPVAFGSAMYDNPKVPGPALFMGLMVSLGIVMFFFVIVLGILRGILRWIVR
jgi:hypothetical protein